MNDQDKSKEALIAELEALRRENEALRATAAEAGDRSDPPDEVKARRKDKTILIVDDNEDTRTIVLAMVADFGYTTIEAASPREAVDRVATKGETIDLVISDIVMPDGGGPEMMEKILAIKPDIKVIFMSGYAEDEIVHDAVFKIQHSCATFIKKPFTLDEIAPLIQNQVGV